GPPPPGAPGAPGGGVRCARRPFGRALRVPIAVHTSTLAIGDAGKQYRMNMARIRTLLPAATYVAFGSPRHIVQNDETRRLVHFRELASTLLTTNRSYVNPRLEL